MSGTKNKSCPSGSLPSQSDWRKERSSMSKSLDITARLCQRARPDEMSITRHKHAGHTHRLVSCCSTTVLCHSSWLPAITARLCASTMVTAPGKHLLLPQQKFIELVSGSAKWTGQSTLSHWTTRPLPIPGMQNVFFFSSAGDKNPKIPRTVHRGQGTKGSVNNTYWCCCVLCQCCTHDAKLLRGHNAL